MRYHGRIRVSSDLSPTIESGFVDVSLSPNESAYDNPTYTSLDSVDHTGDSEILHVGHAELASPEGGYEQRVITEND